MTSSRRRFIAGSALAGLLVLSLVGGASWMPACPLGADPLLPTQSVCAQSLGGLWRSLVVGLGAGGLSMLVALSLAVSARVLRGWFGMVVEKGAELFFALPDVLVLIGIGFAVSVMESEGGRTWPRLGVMVVSLTAIGWAAPARQLQNRLRTLELQPFVTAAEAVGASRWHVVRAHLLPLAKDYTLTLALLRVPALVLAESTVSFLGFGLPMDEPSLGAFLGSHADRLLVPGQLHVVLPAWGLLAGLVLLLRWAGDEA
ncbi:MAG: hypothetical protein RL199_2268 [Pseudomonadota bacterium]|jgi:ABC-type dipeptide/oligopeptide/nickel transport system permease subunit